MISLARKTKSVRSFQGGRYVVHSLLGSGATGSVYEVGDLELDGEKIALKVLHAHLLNNETLLSRFRAQVLLARQLSNPNIVQVYDFDSDEEGNHFVTMELIAGRSLKDFLHGREHLPLSFEEALHILLDVASALAYAHSRGIIHRDLKPSNLLVSFEGEVKLADFGLASGLESDFGLTQTGEFVGTPAYMSPEQFRGEDPDARSDVYSFGILAYQLTQGSLPFGELPYLAQADAHLTKQFPALQRSGREPLPLWFEDFVKKCCEKRPEDRYDSASSLVTMLREHLSSETTATKKGLRFSFLKKSPGMKIRRQVRTWMFFLVVAVTVIFAVSMRQANTRRFMGRQLLRLERVLGSELKPLKALFGVQVSLLHPEEFVALVQNGDNTHASIESYLAVGGKIDMRDAQGNTLIHLALQNPETNILLLLRDAGLDINAKNNKGETPLLLALHRNYPSQAIFLLRANANPNLCDNASNCPLHYALKNHDVRNLADLLMNGANAMSLNGEGRNILHESARDLELDELTRIIAQNTAGAYVSDSRDREGLTPLMYASQSQAHGSPVSEIIKILIQSGASVHARDNLGRTPLLHALLNKNGTAVETLLNANSDPLAKDAAGKSAGEYARESGLQDLLPLWRTP